MSDEAKLSVNYEEDEQDVMDEVETEIELLDQDYVDDEPEEDDADDVAVKTPDQVAVEQKMEQLRDRLEGGESSTAAAMREIAETMKDLRKQPEGSGKEEAVEDLQVLRKKLADGFYDDPMTAVDTWIEKRLSRYEQERLQPAFNQMAQVLKDTTLDGSKRAAQQTDTGKFVMERYASEVEKLVESGQVQIGPGAYEKAINQVASSHLDELLDWKIEQREAAKPKVEADLTKPGRGANPAGGGAAPSPNSKVQVSRAARDAIYAMADQKWIDREQFMESFVRNHPDKVRELNRRAR